MPIRYFIDLNCKPRNEMGADELLTLLSRWERAESVRGQFVEKYSLDDESKMRFRETVTTPGGESEKRERTVAELREETSVLSDLSGSCEGCLAALNGTPYSCVQAIGLPISQLAEQWLLQQLAPGGTRGLELFLDACSRYNYGSIPALQNWRRAGILDSSETQKADRDGILVTSDQILNELFFVGDIQPGHALGILVHLGALKASDGREGDELLALMENVDQTASTESAPTIDFGLAPDEEDDDSIRDLKQFLFAMFRAFSLEVPLAIRL